MTSQSIAQDARVWQRHIVTDVMIWEEVTILVSYEPDWFGLGHAGFDNACALLELQVLHPAGAPIPLGDGTYWSEFIEPGEVDAAGGPVRLATELLNEMSDSLTWRVRRARWELQEPGG